MPQGDWQTTRKTADWPQVIKLTKDALATKSKDLQLAVWLTEALLRREGFAGFRGALDMLVGLLEQHWDHLYPEIDDGDAEMRAAPLEWLGRSSKLPIRARCRSIAPATTAAAQGSAVAFRPRRRPAHDSRRARLVRHSSPRARRRPKIVESAVPATPKPWLKALVADIDGYARVAPESRRAVAQSASATTRRATRSFATRSRRCSAPRSSYSSESSSSIPIRSTAPRPGERGARSLCPQGVVLPGAVGVQARSRRRRRRATTPRIASPPSAKYLRQTDPTNPAPYLLLRGFRWGELRASGASSRSASARGAADADAHAAQGTAARLEVGGAARGVRRRHGDAAGPRLARPPALCAHGLRAAGRGVPDRRRRAARRAAFAARGPSGARRHDADGRHADGERRDAQMARQHPGTSRPTPVPEQARRRGRDPSRSRRARRPERRRWQRCAPAAPIARSRSSCARRRARRRKRGRFLVQTELASIMVDGGPPRRGAADSRGADRRASKATSSRSGRAATSSRGRWRCSIAASNSSTVIRALVRRCTSASAGSIRSRRSASPTWQWSGRRVGMTKREIERDGSAVAPRPADRLRATQQQRRARVGYLESVRQFKTGLQRDLEWLLNTRRIPVTAPEEFEELTQSVYHFGLPDIDVDQPRLARGARPPAAPRRGRDRAVRAASRQRAHFSASRWRASSIVASCDFTSKAHCSWIRRRSR